MAFLAKALSKFRPVVDASEAEQAINRASEDLAKSIEKGAEITEVVTYMATERRVNHFAKRIEDSMRGAN